MDVCHSWLFASLSGACLVLLWRCIPRVCRTWRQIAVGGMALYSGCGGQPAFVKDGGSLLGKVFASFFSRLKGGPPFLSSGADVAPP